MFSTQITSSLSPAHQTSLSASRRSDSNSATSAAAVGARAADRPVMNLRPAPVNNKHAWLLAVSADARREQRPDLYCYAFCLRMFDAGGKLNSVCLSLRLSVCLSVTLLRVRSEVACSDETFPVCPLKTLSCFFHRKVVGRKNKLRKNICNCKSYEIKFETYS